MSLRAGAGDVPALHLVDVGVRFGGIAALDAVALSVAPGEVCGLIGANGAGKTTLFDVISGVRIPDLGRVHLHGRDVTRWSPHRRARSGLRRTFQRVQVFGWLTIEENLLVASEWHGGGGGVMADLVGSPTRRKREVERRERARAILARCGLEKLRDRRAAGLPIGTARLVELGRALVDEPSLLLLDEPASGLDHGEAERFADVVESVEEGFTRLNACGETQHSLVIDFPCRGTRRPTARKAGYFSTKSVFSRRGTGLLRNVT